MVAVLQKSKTPLRSHFAVLHILAVRLLMKCHCLCGRKQEPLARKNMWAQARTNSSKQSKHARQPAAQRTEPLSSQRVTVSLALSELVEPVSRLRLGGKGLAEKPCPANCDNSLRRTLIRSELAPDDLALCQSTNTLPPILRPSAFCPQGRKKWGGAPGVCLSGGRQVVVFAACFLLHPIRAAFCSQQRSIEKVLCPGGLRE